MLEKPIDFAEMWMTVQQPCISSFVPNSYLLLLSALDNGWQLDKAELLPSWDQHGFVYLITLYLYNHNHSQQLILPKNPLIDSLLDENLKEPSCRWSMAQSVVA